MTTEDTENTERATPETDAAQHEGLLRTNPIPMQVVTANFARKLERERDAVRDGFVMAVDEMVQAQSKLREARSIAAELAAIASHCLGSHSFALDDTALKIAAALKRWKKSK